MEDVDSIKIQKKGKEYILSRDDNFKTLIGISYIAHIKYVEAMNSQDEDKKLVETKEFLSLMERLSKNVESVEVSSAELKSLKTWTGFITNIIIELDSIDLKEKNMVKFLKISERFSKKVDKLLTQK